MTKKTIKQVCTCENCGNEAEMQITCDWVEEQVEEPKKPEKKQVKGTGVCTQCGNEADMWVEV